MMNPMRRSRLPMLSALISAVFVMVALCPCGAIAQTGTPAHDCCAAEAGIQAAPPSCCTAMARPAEQVATPALAAVAMPTPQAVTLPIAIPVAPVTVGPSQLRAVFVSPPPYLRI